MAEQEKYQYPFYDPDLPLEERIEDLLSRLTISEKIRFIPSRQPAIDRLGIQEYTIGGEAAHGLVFRRGPQTTVFPQTIGLSCTWDRELLHRIGDVVGQEARAYYEKNGQSGGLTLWAPTVDLGRDPRWGRTEEIYGEDPFLTGELATEYIKGMQGEDPFYIKAAAALKHFYANNNEIDRERCSVSIDERQKREYYWEVFRKPIVEGRAACVMTAYNEVNGVPCNLNPEINEVVKEEWGLPGFVVSDGGDFRQTVTCHKYFESYARTAAETLKSGVDCIPSSPDVGKEDLIIEAFEKAHEEGLINEEDLDRAVRNIFRIRFRLGQFDPEDRNPFSGVPASVICCDEHDQIALEAAQKAIVLLKNENNILPLNKKAVDSIAVIGPLGDKVYRDWYTGTAPYQISPLEGIKNEFTSAEVSFFDSRDQVVFKSQKNGKYLGVLNEEGLLAAVFDQPCPETMFKINDWGWGKITLQSVYNGKYVTEKENYLQAEADEVWGWFVREKFQLETESDGSITLQNYQGRYFGCASRGENLELLELKQEASTSENNKLEMKIIEPGIKKAEELAQKAEVAIVFVGNHPLINGREDYDRPALKLPPAQKKLLQKVQNINPTTILTIIGSYPYSITWAQENVPGILYSSHGGQELGNALSSALSGAYSPAGRLSMTWYKSQQQLPDIKDYDLIAGKRTYMYFEGEPLYPFGYGKTYTNFAYSNLELNKELLSEKDNLRISFDLKNIGYRESDEVSQLYIKSLTTDEQKPQKQLKEFKRIFLAAGEKKKITFELPVSEFSFWDKKEEKFKLPEESFKIMVGASSEDIRLEEEIALCRSSQVANGNTQLKLSARNYDKYKDIQLIAEDKPRQPCVAFTENGGWLGFREIEIPPGATKIRMAISGGIQGVELEFKLDTPTGVTVARYSDSSIGNSFVKQSVSLEADKIWGQRDLFIRGNAGSKICWCEFC